MDMFHSWGKEGSPEVEIGTRVMMGKFGNIIAVRSAQTKSLSDA